MDTKSNETCECNYRSSAKALGFLADWVSAYVFVKANCERLILYALVSLLGSLLIIFLILSCRLFYQKRRALKEAKQIDFISRPPSNLTRGQSREAALESVNVRSTAASQVTLNQGSNGPSAVQASPSSHREPNYQSLTIHNIGSPSNKEEVRYATVPINRTIAGDSSPPNETRNTQIKKGSRGGFSINY